MVLTRNLLIYFLTHSHWSQMAHSGLVVTQPTTVHQIPGSNPIEHSLCVCHKNHCNIQLWAQAAHHHCSGQQMSITFWAEHRAAMADVNAANKRLPLKMADLSQYI